MFDDDEDPVRGTGGAADEALPAEDVEPRTEAIEQPATPVEAVVVVRLPDGRFPKGVSGNRRGSRKGYMKKPTRLMHERISKTVHKLWSPAERQFKRDLHSPEEHVRSNAAGRLAALAATVAKQEAEQAEKNKGQDKDPIGNAWMDYVTNEQIHTICLWMYEAELRMFDEANDSNLYADYFTPQKLAEINAEIAKIRADAASGRRRFFDKLTDLPLSASPTELPLSASPTEDDESSDEVIEGRVVIKVNR